MRFHSYSYIPQTTKTALSELQDVGFALSLDHTDKENLEVFVRRCFFLNQDTDQALHQLIANWDCDLLSFFQSDKELTEEIFYQVSFQLLGFVPHFDYTDVLDFHQQTGLPIVYGNLIDNLYQLLNLRTKQGNSLIDKLVSDDVIAEDNTYHFFNGKSLSTFSTKSLIREVVYVDTPVDTTGQGENDLVKVSILRPRVNFPIPAVITNSPYHQGVNEVASDKALHDMKGELQVKETGLVTLQDPAIPDQASLISDLPSSPATEQPGHMGSYSLNDYFLARGFASIHVSGIGTLGSTGMMTSGDYQQVAAFAAVIDWLNGRRPAYTSHSRQAQVIADWSTGKVATTGLSYLGTMSNALATTGVDGLEVIIAEAGISSWYDYYRENGLVTSPGGYPGEDLDSLTALTYSKSLQAGDYLRNRQTYEAAFTAERIALDRQTGNYNQYWQDRNYLLQADKVRCEVVLTHGSQDWNVQPIHAWNFYHALPKNVNKHLFFHNGAHVYMNNWQSIDFRESMNALLTQKLLGYDNGYQLPALIWQENDAAQSWVTLPQFGSDKQQIFPLGHEIASMGNQYEEEQFDRYSKAYVNFHQDLYEGKAQQVLVDIPIQEDIHINGRARIKLRVASSIDKGLISARLLDYGQKKRLAPIPSPLTRNSLDNGRYHAQENLVELPFSPSPYRMITKGHLNLQHRSHLLTIEEIPSGQWLDINWELQPTIYKLKKGDTLRLLLYTTDFETTIRDNGDWTISIDLENSFLELPIN